MEFFLNAGLGIGVLMFLLLLFKQHKNQGDFLFLGWILVVLGQISFYLITIYHFQLEGIWAILMFGLPMLGSPLLFLYIWVLTGRRLSIKVFALHISSYILYTIIFFLLQQNDQIHLIATNGYFELQESSPRWMQHYATPLAISGLVYCIWDLILLQKHRRTISDLFSYDEKINLKWVSYIVYSYFLLFVVTSFFIFGAIQFQLFPIKNAFTFVGITLSFMLIAFGFYGFRQTAIFSNIDSKNTSDFTTQNAAKKASYLKSGLSAEDIEIIAKKLTAHMDSEKSFLNEELSLGLLSAETKITPSHISQVINQHFKMNFYEFVNQYRVQEAKHRLSSPEFSNLSILGIAFDCGFKSKSSFNRYFKKYTGTSPSAFKNNMSE